MFTDDTAFVVHNQQDAQEIITRLSKSAKTFGLKISLKNMVMYQIPSRTHDIRQDIQIEGLPVSHRPSQPPACLQSMWTASLINLRSRSQVKKEEVSNYKNGSHKIGGPKFRPKDIKSRNLGPLRQLTVLDQNRKTLRKK